MDFKKRFPLRLWRPAVDDEVDDELEFHLAMRQRELMARGLGEEQARRAALERFGNYTQARRTCRAIGHQREQRMRLLQHLSELRQDAAFAIRQFVATPGFSLVALATLALGIGATTAIFSTVHAVLLEPLPLPQPERIVVVNSGWRDGLMSVSPRHYLHVAREQSVFQSISAKRFSAFALSTAGGAEFVVGARVTGQYFEVLRVAPLLGRVFGRSEDSPGADAVVVLSHRLWTRSFGADRSVVGRHITLDARPYTVIGVMPGSFDFSSNEEELWVPMAFTADERENRGSHFLSVHARLRDDTSLEQAAAQMPVIIKKRLAEWPDESPERTLHVTPMMESFVGAYRERLMVLFGAVALVLLIACGNVSNLLLARGSARARELAVRSALGAGQGRLVRQLFTESLVLAVAAAAVGTALAHSLIELLVTFTPPGVRRLDQARIDAVTLTFAIALAVISSIVFGLLPAWRASRADVNSTLKEAGRGAGSRQTRDYVRSTLMAAEVALALVLLVGAGLLIRTGLEVQRVSPGFDPQGLFTGRVLPPLAKYSGRDAMMALTRRLEERVHAIPGVDSVALANVVPGVRAFNNGLLAEGRPLSLDNIVQTDGVFVTPPYFKTMGIAIVDGRAFDDTDRAGTPLVVILNKAAAGAIWPGEHAIGKRLTSANPLGPTTVIGIAADVRIGGPSEPAPPTFYVPMAQLNEDAWGWVRSLFIAARTQGQPATLGPAIRTAVSEVDPGIPLYSAMTMEERMAATIQAAKFNTLLLTMLGGAGLLLAVVGIYGVIGYFATQRTSEIGIRMALGATRGDVVRLVVQQAAGPVVGGVVLGASGAAFAARALASQLVNVTPTDPLTFTIVAAFLLVVGLAAALIPARRAAALDPTKALNG